MMQEKQNAEKHRALRLESNQHSQEKNDDGRNERATREGRGAQRGTVRRRVEPREVFCSVSKSFAFECYVTSTSAYLLQQKKLNNRNRISPQSEKYIARKWYYDSSSFAARRAAENFEVMLFLCSAWFEVLGTARHSLPGSRSPGQRGTLFKRQRAELLIWFKSVMFDGAARPFIKIFHVRC